MSEKNIYIKKKNIYIYIYIYLYKKLGAPPIGISPRASNWLETALHIDIVKKAQQRLYFLRQLRKINLPQELLKQFYSAIIESILCTSITVWFSSATKSDHRRLRSVVRTADRIIGTTLPTLQELYLSRVSKRAGKIILDPSHPAHSLFELLPSGRRYRALSTRTTRHRKDSIPPLTVLHSNSLVNIHSWTSLSTSPLGIGHHYFEVRFTSSNGGGKIIWTDP